MRSPIPQGAWLVGWLREVGEAVVGICVACECEPGSGGGRVRPREQWEEEGSSAWAVVLLDWLHRVQVENAERGRF